VVLGLALVLTGCNEGPAEEALAHAEAMLEDAGDTLERFAPDERARLEGELSTARQALAEGRYTDALRTAQELPDGISEALDRAAARRGGLESAWEDASGAIPRRLSLLRSRLREVATSLGSQEGGLGDARGQLRGLESRWAEAKTAFHRGRLSRAVAEATAVEQGIDELSDTLGCTPGC
jgi:plasmid stabilization system protein ParE